MRQAGCGLRFFCWQLPPAATLPIYQPVRFPIIPGFEEDRFAYSHSYFIVWTLALARRMWLFFQYQQHAAKSKSESNSNAVLSKPGPFTDSYSIS